MSERRWGRLVGLLWGAVMGASVLTGGRSPAADDRAAPTPAAKSGGRAADVFGLTKLHQFHVEMSAKEWDRMEPKGGLRFPGMPAPVAPPPQPGEEPVEKHRSVGFGIEFPWAKATLVEGDRAYKDVGIRFKGNGSYMPTVGRRKRNLKIELDHYDKALRFHGLKTLNFNAGAADPTRFREALAFAVFREAGVPAPRTAYAELTLTVPGKFDREVVGLYTLVEQVDKVFLRDRFGTDKGLLLKPERMRGIDYLGEDWSAYTGQYQPRDEATKKQARRVIDFARLVHKASDEQFRQEIGSYLDLDEFLRFFAANALVTNLDSFFSIGHNVFIYLHPETNKFLFIPWDLDLSFGGFFIFGTPEQQADISLTQPYSGQVKLVDRLFAIPEVKEKYQAILKELSTGCFRKEHLLKNLDAVEAATREAVAREKKAIEARKEPANTLPFALPGAKPPDLRVFVAKRTEAVAAQIAGKSKGRVPTGGFGPPPGGAGRPGGPFANPLVKPLLEALDTDKDKKASKAELVAGVEKFFNDCDKEKAGTLDENQVIAGLNRIFPRLPGLGGPPGGARPGGPPPGAPPAPPAGFGPGNFLAGPLVHRCDTDKNGLLARREMVAAAEAVFQEADKDKDNQLDEKELGAAFTIVFPPPPGFGPPAGPAPGKPEAPKKP